MSTKIRWTNRTWNPVTGCSHVSPGCEHCYAEAISLRFKRSAKPWKAQFAAENVILHPERVDQPLHWRTPARVFVNSMSDLFHEGTVQGHQTFLTPDGRMTSIKAGQKTRTHIEMVDLGHEAVGIYPKHKYRMVLPASKEKAPRGQLQLLEETA